jgi:hypothetical protein
MRRDHRNATGQEERHTKSDATDDPPPVPNEAMDAA